MKQERAIHALLHAAGSLFCFLIFSVSFESFGQPFTDTVVALENQKPGTSAWLLTSPATNREIEGYANLTSVNRGGQLKFFVNTTNTTYVLDCFRVGWYGGTGSRAMLGPVIAPGSVQPIPTRDPATGLVECNWTNPWSLNIPNTPGDPTDWASGVYLARLTGGQDGKQSYIIFAVRDDARPTDLLAQMSFNTYQAYNNWGGASLYGFNSTPAPAQKVSFNRPFASGPGVWRSYWMGSGDFFDCTGSGWECDLVHWLEREGYDVSYCTSLDTHSVTNLLSTHQGFISMGHDEYWSYPMRRNVEAARDQGVNLAFFSANTCFWQVRLEPSTVDGAANRNLVCYKSQSDPLRTTTSNFLTTVNFRSPPVNDPESSLLGVAFNQAGVAGDLVVSDPNHWMFTNTDVRAGQLLPGLLGYEVDCTNNVSPTNIQIACASPYTVLDRFGNPVSLSSDATTYTAASGATVFAAGSMQWTWGLNDLILNRNRSSCQSPALQTITRNILAHISNRPVPGSTLFFHADLTTRGDWKPNYGADGYILPNDSTNLPAYVTLDTGMATADTYLPSSNDANSLPRGSSAGRYLAGWFATTNFTMDVNLTDGKNHPVALYLWDWNHSGRSQLVEVFDATGTNLLDRRVITEFTRGQWWVWQVNGHVRFKFTNLSGPDCLVNALAFGNGAEVSYVAEDLLTQGNWKSYYGSEGHFIAGDTPHPSSYANIYSWSSLLLNSNALTQDPRALQLSGSTNRTSALWAGGIISGFHLEARDNSWHKLAIYCLDAEHRGRRQQISLFDPGTQVMLDRRQVANFDGGKYLVWNFRGSVDVHVQNFGPVSSAISGIFLGPSNQPPVVVLTSPTNLQTFHLPTNIVVTASASDFDGSIRRVNFYADGILLGATTNSPYAIIWTNALTGQHIISAVAIDNNIAYTFSQRVRINVLPPPGYQPPDVQILSPTNTARARAPVTLYLSGSAIASSAPIVGMQFQVDGTPYGRVFTNTAAVVTASNLFAGIHTVSLVVTDAYGIVTSSPANLITLLAPAAAAVFRKYDFALGGHWMGSFGLEGYVVINDVTNLPPPFLLLPSANNSGVFAAATTDPRALQDPNTGGTEGFAGYWASDTNLLLDVNLVDGNTHRIELYCLDWQRQNLTQTIQVIDPSTGNVLDTRSVEGYTNGAYLIWDVTGHVQFSLYSNPSNRPVMLSGIFLDPPRTQPQVSLLKPAGGSFFAAPTNILIGAYAFGGTNDLVLVEFLTNGTHLAYGDGGIPASFKWIRPSPGIYTLTARVWDRGGQSAVSPPATLSVEAVSAGAQFVQANTNHLENWRGVIGRQGSVVAGDSTNLPGYAAIGILGQINSWPNYSADARALVRGDGATRVAAGWSDATNVLVDVKCSDATFHRVTLYFMDWFYVDAQDAGDDGDLASLNESVDLLDVVSGTVLDHELVPAFTNGVYEVWDIRGHVQIRISRTGGLPAIASGVFFDASEVMPAITITNPLDGTLFITPTNIILAASAAADTNNVTQVAFYDGATWLGTVPNLPPYTLTWTNAPVGNHTLVAQELGPAGSVSSAPVSISVFASNAVSFLGATLLPDGTAQFDVLAPPGNSLSLEGTFDLSGSPVWTSLQTNTSANNWFEFIVTDPTNYPRRFYRIKQLP